MEKRKIKCERRAADRLRYISCWRHARQQIFKHHLCTRERKSEHPSTFWLLPIFAWEQFAHSLSLSRRHLLLRRKNFVWYYKTHAAPPALFCCSFNLRSLILHFVKLLNSVQRSERVAWRLLNCCVLLWGCSADEFYAKRFIIRTRKYPLQLPNNRRLCLLN